MFEKEAEEYAKEHNHEYYISMVLKDPILQQGFECICKENAELRKQLEMSNKVYNDNLDYSHHIEGQLTKAKELLAKWVELFKPKSNIALPIPIQVDTEQFLMEVEK
jgi:hypothetical protein